MGAQHGCPGGWHSHMPAAADVHVHGTAHQFPASSQRASTASDPVPEVLCEMYRKYTGETVNVYCTFRTIAAPSVV
jgi:hypothetical protein